MLENQVENLRGKLGEGAGGTTHASKWQTEGWDVTEVGSAHKAIGDLQVIS